MGEEDSNIPDAEDTIILSAEDMDKILKEDPEDEKPKEEE